MQRKTLLLYKFFLGYATPLHNQMSNELTLSEIKGELKALIRYNADRGFLPYSGCNRVCDATLLSKEGELWRLIGVVQANNMYIEHYGKQLARVFPEDTYSIYEKYILKEAAAATDRRKYKGVCKLIKSYSDAGAKEEARYMIRRLIEKYPRRAARVDELEALGRKMMK